VEVAHVADAEELPADRRARLLLRAAVREGRARGERDPDRPDLAGRERSAVVVADLDPEARPRRADAARLPEPVLRSDARGAAFRRAVELPYRAGREDLHDRLLDGDGTGRGRVQDLPDRRQVVARSHVLGEAEDPEEH